MIEMNNKKTKHIKKEKLNLVSVLGIHPIINRIKAKLKISIQINPYQIKHYTYNNNDSSRY